MSCRNSSNMFLNELTQGASYIIRSKLILSLILNYFSEMQNQNLGVELNLCLMSLQKTRKDDNCKRIATWRLPDVAPVVLGCFGPNLYCVCVETANLAIWWRSRVFLLLYTSKGSHISTYSLFELMTLKFEHLSLSHVAHRTGMIFTKIEVDQPTRFWLINYVFLLLIRYVTLRYLDLWWIFRIFWPLRTHSTPGNFKFRQN